MSRFREYLDRKAVNEKPPEIVFYWHGGEPLLVGKEYFTSALEIQSQAIGPFPFRNSVQTNATLLDDEWIDLLKSGRFSLGVSLDGTPAQHDTARVFHNGAGSYFAVERAIHSLVERHLPFQVLVVIDPARSARSTLDHLVSLGCKKLDFLLPMYNCESAPRGIAEQCAHYLIDLFDYWFLRDDPEIDIRYFRSILQLMLGGRASLCTLRNDCAGILTIEPNGIIGLCDDLSIVEDTSMFRLPADIEAAQFEVLEQWTAKRIGDLGINVLSFPCRNCDVAEYCQGGCPSKRFSSLGRFNNPSVYCYTFRSVVSHIVERLGADRVNMYRSKVAADRYPVNALQ
jgi:uncharacterized protein